jgi:mRNA interferase HigB
MRVRLLRRDTIEEFANNHANGKIHFNNWLAALKYADWEEPQDIIYTYRGNLLGNDSNRVVFDIGGNGRNAFRLICEYRFGLRCVHIYVNWIGTHEEYNALSNQQKRTITNY